MRSHSIGQAFRDPPFDGADIDAQNDARPEHVFAATGPQRMRDVQRARHAHLQLLDEFERNREGQHSGRRECAADALTSASNAVDLMLTDQSVESTAIDVERFGDNDRTECPQIIPALGNIDRVIAVWPIADIRSQTSRLRWTWPTVTDGPQRMLSRCIVFSYTVCANQARASDSIVIRDTGIIILMPQKCEHHGPMRR